MSHLLPQDLEKPTAIAYRMKGGGQPGGSGSSSTEDPPRRPPEPKPKPKPSQCLPLEWFQGGRGEGALLLVLRGRMEAATGPLGLRQPQGGG